MHSNQDIAEMITRLETNIGLQMASLSAKVDDLSLKVSSMGGSSLSVSAAQGSAPVACDTLQRPEDAKQQTKRAAAAKRRETLMTKFAKEEVFGVKSSDALADAPRGCTYYLRRGLVLPNGVFRQTWDSLFIVAGFYVVTLLPYRIAFAEEHSVPYAVIDLTLDVFFIADLLLNFCTAYHRENGDLVLSHRAIARQYLHTWFVPDCFSSIPFDWMINGINISDDGLDAAAASGDLTELRQLLRALKTIKLLRLLRVTRAGRYLQRLLEHASLEVVLNSNALRLMGVAIFMVLFAHWNGCLQYLFATFEAEVLFVNGTTQYEFHPDSWVARMRDEGRLDSSTAWSWAFYTAWMQMLSIADNDPTRQIELWGYLASILCAFTRTSPVAYTASRTSGLRVRRAPCACNTSRAHAACYMLVRRAGCVIYALFLASLTRTIAESDQSGQQYRKPRQLPSTSVASTGARARAHGCAWEPSFPRGPPALLRLLLLDPRRYQAQYGERVHEVRAAPKADMRSAA